MKKLIQYIYNKFRKREIDTHKPNVRVTDFMIPRKDIDAVSIDMDIVELKKIFLETGHKCLPVYKETLDDICGLIDVNQILHDHNWIDKITEATCIPPSIDIQDAAYILIGGKVNFILILDEYGGIDGLLTAVCILKNYTKNVTDMISIGKNKWLISGRLKVTNFAEKIGENIICTESTMGGYLCELFGKVPNRYEKIKHGNIIYTVQEANDKCIYSIICHKNE